MAKARASQKSGRSTGKVKAKPAKAAGAKARRVKPVRSSPAKARNATPPRIAAERKPAPVVEIPEIPPPLPAPIASFTF